MEKNATKLQVDIISASNVLSNYSNSNRMTSYLPSKNLSPSNNDFSKITAFYGSPRNNIRKYEDCSQNRGVSVETPSTLLSAAKKEHENAYFLKSPLMSSMDSQKNHSFNNIIGNLEAKKYELECKNNRSIKNDNVSHVPDNIKLLRNSSMSKLASSNYKKHGNESTENHNLFKKTTQIQMPNNKPNYEIPNYMPKSFLLNNNNQKDNLMSPKQTKIEQVYEKIKQAQSVKKTRNYNEIAQSSYASAEKVNFTSTLKKIIY